MGKIVQWDDALKKKESKELEKLDREDLNCDAIDEFIRDFMQDDLNNLNIDIEKNFLNLFGFSVSKISDTNYNILDNEKNQTIGSIQYKIVDKAKPEKGIPDLYGYVMKIDSPIITCENLRYKYLQSYIFFVKTQEENVEVHLDIMDIIDNKTRKELRIYSKKYGIFAFCINSDNSFSLHLENMQTNNYYYEEWVIVDVSKRFKYSLNYKPKNKNSIQKKIEKKMISIEYDKSQEYPLKIIEPNVDNASKQNEFKYKIDADLVQIIKKSKNSLKCFSYFRYVANQLLPFQDEVVKSLLENVEDLEPEIALFVPDLKEIRHNRTFLDKCKEYLRVRRK